ncbi:response regulator [Cyanobacteria bacterium FACHB-502]|nr:response regulator [Cyanobacteria bacterium FACHB-502]
MKALSERVGALLHYAHADSSQHPELLPQALAELGNSLEELRISQEALHQQNQELLEAQVALEVERQRYQELFEFAPDGYLITDTDGKIQRANHTMSQLLRVSQPFLIGKLLTSYVAEPERRAFDDELNRLPQVGRLQEWVTQLQPYGASAFDAALTVTTVSDSTGTIVSLRWLVRDITERKQLEATRLRATLAEMTNQALEAEIAQRKQLEQELRQQTESLHQANTLKDEFLAIVSHELRSPLNVILGWAQMLRSRQLDETMMARAVETIERNAKAQVKLIEDLLDISRIIRGSLHLNIRPVNLVSVIQEAIDAVQLAVTAKNIEIRSVLDESTSLVSGDSDRLQQVIWNLLSNAIKFTPRQGQIEVRLEQVSSNAVITVSDTGQGIDPAFLPYVFDRFRQAERATTRHHGGLGLGLAIVRQLVEMHGGTVAANSSGEGQGATFTVQIPLMAVCMEPSEAQTSIPEKANAFALHHSLSNVDVLVVDDEADTRNLLTVVLERAGATVRSADSVNEALHMIERSQPDILISDVGMPEQDGYALIRQVRENESERVGTIPAIALTAYAREEDRRQLLKAGFQLHLSKPVESTALVAAVVSQVGRSA